MSTNAGTSTGVSVAAIIILTDEQKTYFTEYLLQRSMRTDHRANQCTLNGNTLMAEHLQKKSAALLIAAAEMCMPEEQ